MQHSRNRDLDGVRGLAILLVVAAHSGLPVRWGGLSGVTLFFVLSGYLITSLLIREWDRSPVETTRGTRPCRPDPV